MSLCLICVGKLKEAYFRAGAAEYEKRLSRFGGMEIIECPDGREPKNPSPADLRRVVAGEGAAILEKLRPTDRVVALCIDGKTMTSTALAETMKSLEERGAGRIVFIIGGSNGLSDEVIHRAMLRLSFSPMTFPHQLARIMLLEQVYRARKILAGETYHK